ncbi:hypothetical protein ACFYNM_29900 [Streptomyces spororaveus]|uniref:hypothetical protein n=1 Tax=Streptomyces spororaveus TaxID=284039 RepID=UPI003688400A
MGDTGLAEDLGEVGKAAGLGADGRRVLSAGIPTGEIARARTLLHRVIGQVHRHEAEGRVAPG